jgi:hypothetical protein
VYGAFHRWVLSKTSVTAGAQVAPLSIESRTLFESMSYSYGDMIGADAVMRTWLPASGAFVSTTV